MLTSNRMRMKYPHDRLCEPIGLKHDLPGPSRQDLWLFNFYYLPPAGSGFFNLEPTNDFSDTLSSVTIFRSLRHIEESEAHPQYVN